MRAAARTLPHSAMIDSSSTVLMGSRAPGLPTVMCSYLTRTLAAEGVRMGLIPVEEDILQRGTRQNIGWGAFLREVLPEGLLKKDLYKRVLATPAMAALGGRSILRSLAISSGTGLLPAAHRLK